MPVSPTRSVTEQTADLASTSPQVHSQSWQHALHDAKHHILRSGTTAKPPPHPAVTPSKTTASPMKAPLISALLGRSANASQKSAPPPSTDKPGNAPKKAAAHHHQDNAAIAIPLTQNTQPIVPMAKSAVSLQPAHEDMGTAPAHAAPMHPIGITPEVHAAYLTTPAGPALPTSPQPVIDATATSASALAATVTALHRAGQIGAVLRLDPPGLGFLSVQIGLTTQGHINIMFVPSTANAAQALQGTLPHLHHAMSQSGLTLGQAHVGGQFSQSGGQGGQNGQKNPATSAHTAPRSDVDAATAPALSSGLSAYA